MSHEVGKIGVDNLPESISRIDTAAGNYIEEYVVAGDGSLVVEWVDVSTFGVGAASIYTASGTLEEDRTVTGDGNDLIFTGSPLFAVRDTTLIDLDGALVVNESSAVVDVRFEGGTEANLLFLDGSTDRIGIGTATPATTLDIVGSLAVSTTLAVTGATTLAAGVIINEAGGATDVRIEGDTDPQLFVVDGSADTVQIGNAVTADSAKFYVLGKISTSGELEVNGAFNHDGTTFGVFATAPAIQQTALTAQSTSITSTAPGAADYAIQDLVQNTGFGFVTKNEGNTVLEVIANLQTRVQELEDKLQAYGLLA